MPAMVVVVEVVEVVGFPLQREMLSPPRMLASTMEVVLQLKEMLSRPHMMATVMVVRFGLQREISEIVQRSKC